MAVPRYRGLGCAHQRVSARNGGGGVALSRAQPHHQRSEPWDHRGRSAGKERRAHHGKYGSAALITDSWDVLREYEAMYPHKILGERVELPRTLGYQAREEQARARQTASAAAEEAPSLPSLDLKTNDAGLTDDQITILRALKDGAMQVDDIIETTDLPTRRVLSALTMMELEGYVAQGGGKHFSLQVILEK